MPFDCHKHGVPTYYKGALGVPICPECEREEAAAERDAEHASLLAEQLDVQRAREEREQSRRAEDGVCTMCGQRFVEATRRRPGPGAAWCNALAHFRTEGVCPRCFFDRSDKGEVRAWGTEEWRSYVADELPKVTRSVQVVQVIQALYEAGERDLAAEAEQVRTRLFRAEMEKVEEAQRQREEQRRAAAERKLREQEEEAERERSFQRERAERERAEQERKERAEREDAARREQAEREDAARREQEERERAEAQQRFRAEQERERKQWELLGNARSVLERLGKTRWEPQGLKVEDDSIRYYQQKKWLQPATFKIEETRNDKAFVRLRIEYRGATVFEVVVRTPDTLEDLGSPNNEEQWRRHFERVSHYAPGEWEDLLRSL